MTHDLVVVGGGPVGVTMGLFAAPVLLRGGFPRPTDWRPPRTKQAGDRAAS